MLNPERFNEMGEWLSPSLEADGVTYTYANTLIRTFGEEWTFLNHVEHRTKGGTLVGIFVDPEFLEALVEKDFPMRFDPFPDPETREWFLRKEIQEIQDSDAPM